MATASKILILGGSGLLGRALLRAWKQSAEVVATTFSQPVPGLPRVDLTDRPAVREALTRVRPAWTVISAANPFVDQIEAEPKVTRELNVEATADAAEAARELGSRVIFFSSDYVYDGEKGSPYIETDPPTPLNEYGRQKVETEDRILALGGLVIRTSGLYGWQAQPKNLVLQVRETLSKGETFKVSSDITYNPTYAGDLAEAVVALAGKGASGRFHAVGSETVSREEFVRRVARAFDLPENIEPVPPAYFEKTVAKRARRPKFSALSTALLERTIGRKMLGVDAGLRKMRAEQ